MNCFILLLTFVKTGLPLMGHAIEYVKLNICW